MNAAPALDLRRLGETGETDGLASGISEGWSVICYHRLDDPRLLGSTGGSDYRRLVSRMCSMQQLSVNVPGYPKILSLIWAGSVALIRDDCTVLLMRTFESLLAKPRR